MSTVQPIPMTVVEALNAAMTAVGAVAKGDRNNAQNFNFRGIDAVVNACSPAFRQHGIVVTPSLVSIERETTKTAKGATMAVVHVVVAYTFWGPAGDSVTATVAAESFDSGDKATAKAMSVAFRTALLQTLCLPTDDPDPDSTSFERDGAPQRSRYADRPHPAPSAEQRVNAAKQRLVDSVGGDKSAARALWESVVAELGDPPADLARMDRLVASLVTTEPEEQE